MKSKKLLEIKFDLFLNVFKSYFDSIELNITKIDYSNLEHNNEVFPNIPSLELRLANNLKNRTLNCFLYNNFITTFHISNTLINDSFSLNDYMKNKSIKDYNDFDSNIVLNERYYKLLTFYLKILSSSELKSILIGENWTKYPFDWQNQK